MTSIKNFLASCFDCASQDVSVEEKYSEFNFECKLSSLDNIDAVELEEIGNQFHQNDSWRLFLQVGSYDAVSLSKESINVSNFLHEVEQEKRHASDEECVLRLRVDKNTAAGCIAVYDFSAFDSFIGSIKTKVFLNIIKKSLDKKGFVEFISFDDYGDSFSSERVLFNVQPPKSDKENLTSMSDKYGRSYSFRDQAAYPYEPGFFRLVKRSTNRNNLLTKLEILEGIFEIIRIFNLSWFEGDSLLYRLNGYKSIAGEISLDSEPLCSRDIYWKIYEWIYSEEGSVVDKLGIAQNVLSIYLSGDSLLIPEDAYFSTQSAFRTYLQQNLDRYIVIREKLNDQLSLIVQKIDTLMKEYIEGFQKSSFTFISFFISVFLLRVLSTGKYQNVFTKDATIISFSLLFISFLYLCLLSWNVHKQEIRLRRRYGNLKSRFKDLLIEEDIEKILGNDKEFNDEMFFFNQRRWMVTASWLLIILIFLCVTTTLSSYSSWDFLQVLFNCL